jgi:hypothetical protein
MSLWAEVSLCGLEAAWTCAKALSKIPTPSNNSDLLESGLTSLSDETTVFGGVAGTGYVRDDCTWLGDDGDGDGDDSENDPLARRGRFAAQTGEYRFRNPRGSSE